MPILDRTDYAIRALVEIARATPAEGSLGTEEIGRRQGIPPLFLHKVLRELVEAGILTASRGRKGGLRLARPPAGITLEAVVEATQGGIRLRPCVLGDGNCSREDICPVRKLWQEMQGGILERLAGTTLADLLPEEKEAGAYQWGKGGTNTRSSEVKES
ncbi:MAG: Rrf2 family transcriptional regulator [Firmicutes bacterium]|nr:Rrf2 family transcriptional regulator [Bacillota bacterium]